MSMKSKRAALKVDAAQATEPKDPAETTTFFGAGVKKQAETPNTDTPEQGAAGSEPTERPRISGARRPSAGTFFNNASIDTGWTPTTHGGRGWSQGWSAMTEKERAARKQAEEQRIERGQNWFARVIAACSPGK